MPKFVKIERSDADGSYIEDKYSLSAMVDGEFDDLDYLDAGTKITLTVIEMSQEEYDNLPEFVGW